MMRRVGAGAYAAACLALTALLALVWVDMLAGNVVPVLQALTPVWLALAFIPLLIGVMRRSRLTLGAALVVALTAIASALTISGVPHTVAAKSHTLRVLSLNAQLGEADPDDVSALVRDIHPDVVVFVEMTAAKLAQLDARGLQATYPHRSSGMVDDGARGSVILSRWPVATLDANSDLGPFDLQSPVARVSTPGGDVTVHGVHAYPPLADGVRQWRPQLAALGRWQRAHAHERVIMAGDYNASRAHPALRQAADGLRDAVLDAKTGLYPTWPHGDWRPAFTQIDHILTRGFETTDGGVKSVAGTDHAAVWAELTW